MALGHQTKDKTKNAYGWLRWRVKSTSTSTRVTGPNIKAIGSFDFEDKFFEQKAFWSSGEEQLMGLFGIDKATGIVEITVDEITALNATCLGLQTDVEIVQCYPQGSTGWKYLAAKARVIMVSLDPAMREPGTMKIRIVPYNDAGTALFTFDAAATITA